MKQEQMLVKVDRDILNRALGVIEGVAALICSTNKEAGDTLFNWIETLECVIVKEDA